MRRTDLTILRLTYAAWLFGVFVFFTPPATWNPVSRFNLTRAIVEQHTLSIDAYVSTTGDRSLVEGRWYSDKAPLPSFLAVPAYAVVRVSQSVRGTKPEVRAFSEGSTPAVRLEPNRAYMRALHTCSLFTAGLAGVAIGLLLFEFLRRRTTARVAFPASAITVLGTPLLPYSTSFYGHVIAGAALLGALVALDTRGLRPTGALPSPLRQRLAGACLVVAAGSEYLSAMPGALIGMAFLARLPPGKIPGAVGNLLLGALLPAVAIGSYHHVVFGAPWRTGYSFIPRPEFAAGHAQGFLGVNPPRWEGLFGLTFGTRRGLFYLAPVLLLGAIFGVQRAVRTRDFTWVVGIAAFVLLLLLNAGYYMWWGGAAGGPRHVLPCIALLGAGVAVLLRKGLFWRVVTGVLAALSIGNAIALTSVGLEAPEQGDILRDFVWQRILTGQVVTTNGATNLGLELGLPSAFSLIPLAIWLGAGYWYLARHLRARRPPPDARVGSLTPRGSPLRPQTRSREYLSHMVVLELRIPCACILASTLALACTTETVSPPPAPAPSAAVAPETDVAVLPNNVAIQANHNKILAVRREGDVAWELTLPQSDTIIAPTSVALNSFAYVRGAKGIYAASPEGKWAWSKALESRSTTKSRMADQPATFPDSTVAVVVGSDIVRFDEQGVVRWRLSLPEGQVNGRPKAGMDGSLFVPTSAGLYCITPDGNVEWKR